MYKVVKKSRAIQCMIVFVALFIMFTIFPLRLWEENIPSVSNQILAGSSDSVGEIRPPLCFSIFTSPRSRSTKNVAALSS